MKMSLARKRIVPLSANASYIIFLARPPLVSCLGERCHVRECFEFPFASSFGDLARDNVGGDSNIKGDEVRMQMVIVDSHKEVLPYWFKEYLKIKRPFVIVRIDKHHDMNHDCPAFPATEGRQALNYLAKMMLYILQYTEEEINKGNFTCPAFHYGIVGALYHFNPRENNINAYGRVSGKQFVDVCQKQREKLNWLGEKEAVE